VFSSIPINLAYANGFCENVSDQEVIYEVGEIARGELDKRGVPIDQNRGRDVVENCRDFLIFSLASNADILGGIPYVILSYEGAILWVFETY